MCKGISTSTINISSTHSLWCWYFDMVDGYIMPGTTPIHNSISHKTSCADLCCYGFAQSWSGIFLSCFTLPILLTIWYWNSRPVVIILETESHLLTLYPHTRNQAVLSAGSANWTRKDPSTIFKKNSTIIPSRNSNCRFQMVFFNVFLGEKFASLRSTLIFLSVYR